VWQLPAVAVGAQPDARLTALRERMRGLFGGEREWLAVDHAGSLAAAPEADVEWPEKPAAVRLWGFIGKPGVSRGTREDQHLFVNRRPVENRALNLALLEGYHTALMKGRYPVCCLFLEMDPAGVDVNIHPAKREVKFHAERAVRQFVTEAIRQTLLRFHGAATGPQATAPAAPETPSDPAPPAGPSSPPPAPREFPAFTPLTGTPLTSWPKPPARAATVQATPTPAPTVTPPPPLPPALTPPPPSAPLPPASGPTPLLNVPLRMLGVVGRLYVVFESDRGLVLMDQHAAHERVLFEQMLTRLEQGQAPSQRLLLPETLELSVRDAHFLRGQLPTLTRLGVGLSEFGERTFLLDALPPFVKAPDARRFALELVDELKAAGQEVNSLRLGEHTIAKTVCRHAVKANDPLTLPELENLVAALRHCAMPYTCPHGRPTLIEMSYRELEKKFGRQQ
jgi:DNA mismatch repair protein MutL